MIFYHAALWPMSCDEDDEPLFYYALTLDMARAWARGVLQTDDAEAGDHVEIERVATAPDLHGRMLVQACLNRRAWARGSRVAVECWTRGEDGAIRKSRTPDFALKASVRSDAESASTAQGRRT